MTPTAFRLHPAYLAALLGIAALALCGLLLAEPLRHALAQGSGGYDAGRMVLFYATLPRLTMAVLCGAALAMSGAVLQQALHNPLASPTTLGADAGARLALAICLVAFPAITGIGRDLVALAGSAAALLLVLALSRGRAFSAINLVLSGLIISLYCGGLSVILTLVKDRYLVGLFVWGSGSLSQQGWQPAIDLSWRLGLSLLPLAWLGRPLDLLGLGDEAGQGLGVSVDKVRIAAIAIAVMISAFVTASVGVVGFVSLCAPLLARLCGARRFGPRLVWSGIIGACLLLLTDVSLQLLPLPSVAFLPTGAVTAVLGSPLLLALLPRLKFLSPPPSLTGLTTGWHLRPGLVLSGVAGLTLVALLTLLIGRGPDGNWMVAGPADFSLIMPWRAPRFFASCAAGAMLSVAGMILQRLTANPMASPETLGVSAGSILAVALALFVFKETGVGLQYVLAAGGGIAVLFLILFLSRKAGFAPERVLLAGVALSALIDAIIGVMSASGDPNAVMLLSWLGGSTSGIGAGEAVYAGIAALILTAAAMLASRWLHILPLGHEVSVSVGVPAPLSRGLLFGLAAVLTAAATPIVGPLTFVGLLSPHIVAGLGIRKATTSVAATFFVGASLIGLADFLSRTVAFPVLLPTGITAALLGAPFLLFLLKRRMGKP